MAELTSERKIMLAAKYAPLNEIIAQRRKILDEIHDLMDRAEQLKKRADELDEQFHRLVISVEPTEIIDIRVKKPMPLDQSKAAGEIMSVLDQSPPDLRAQIAKILENAGLK